MALLTVVGVLALSACGGNEEDAASSPTEDAATSPAEDAASSPTDCLDDAGLSNVEERDSDLWRGYHDDPFYQVTVERLSSEGAASDLAADAVAVYAASSGVYVVTGPAKPSAGGLVTGADAAEAENLVNEVAACVGG